MWEQGTITLIETVVLISINLSSSRVLVKKNKHMRHWYTLYDPIYYTRGSQEPV